MSTTIVIARHTEDTSWAPENSLIYSKPGDLPNIGREGHTYLYHICKHYASLKGTIIFTQGHPFDHAPRFLQQIQEYPEFTGFSEPMECNRRGAPNHQGLPLESFWKTVFSTPMPDRLIFHPGAIFAVPATIIRKRPRAFYFLLMDRLAYDINPVEGYCLERLWRYIFQYQP